MTTAIDAADSGGHMDPLLVPTRPGPGCKRSRTGVATEAPCSGREQPRMKRWQRGGPSQDDDRREDGTVVPLGAHEHGMGVRLWPGVVDARIEAIPLPWIPAGSRVLDVGCGRGQWTRAMANKWKPGRVVAVDAEASMIRLALRDEEWVKTHDMGRASSTSGGSSSPATASPSKAIDVASAGSDVSHDGSLSSSVALPLAATGPRLATSPWPVSVTQCLGRVHVGPQRRGTHWEWLVHDWVTQPAPSSWLGSYDVITCMSVTKWIHLSHGDAGLQRAFQKAFDCLKPGGRFILEPQDWRSYRRARNTSEVSRYWYDRIRMRPTDFHAYLTTEVGFEKVEALDVPKAKRGFRRNVWAYTRAQQ